MTRVTYYLGASPETSIVDFERAVCLVDEHWPGAFFTRGCGLYKSETEEALKIEVVVESVLEADIISFGDRLCVAFDQEKVLWTEEEVRGGLCSGT